MLSVPFYDESKFECKRNLKENKHNALLSKNELESTISLLASRVTLIPFETPISHCIAFNSRSGCPRILVVD